MITELTTKPLSGLSVRVVHVVSGEGFISPRAFALRESEVRGVLALGDTVEELEDFAVEHGAFVLPFKGVR